MRVITTRYYAVRKHNVKGLLPWHCRNEIINQGFLTVYPYQAKRRRFSIAKWLNDDSYRIENDMPRFSESDFNNNWGAVKDPWEKERTDDVVIPEYIIEKEKVRYLNNLKLKVLDAKADARGILHLPFDSTPIGWACRNGKITLY